LNQSFIVDKNAGVTASLMLPAMARCTMFHRVSCGREADIRSSIVPGVTWPKP